MIYAESREDYFAKNWTAIEFETQLEILEDSEFYVGVKEDGFVRLSLLERIAEFVKGLFGGFDCASEERVQAAALKFFYYGETHGLVDEKHLFRLISQRKVSVLSKSSVSSFIQEMENFHFYQQDRETKSEYLSRLRGLMTDYHRRNSDSLRPGFWTRLTTQPSLDPKTLFSFGDAPLQLMKKALDQAAPDPKLAFHFLQKAFDLKNDEPEFQKKLAAELENLEASYPIELKNYSGKIQERWIELAQNAFEREQSDLGKNYLENALSADSTNAKGRLQIGRLYLINQAFSDAIPFLTELQKEHANDPQILMLIGHTYWQEENYPKAADAYEAALNAYQKPEWKRISAQKEKSLMNYRIGEAYLDGLLPANPGNHAKARKFLLEAVKLDPTAADCQEDLCEAFEEHWQDDQDQFASSSLLDFRQFLTFIDSRVLDNWAFKFSKIFMGCGELFFKSHLNQQAHACLEDALRLSPDHAQMKIDVLALALQYNDTKPLKTKFEHWNKENYANPYLKMKIGEAYWDTSKATAIKAYEEALDLFAKRIAASGDDQEKKECKRCMGEIQAKIGKDHLQTQPGLFGGNPYEQALHRLEKAAALDPSHATQLFDAYLAAAQAEKQRSAFFRDTNKIISYYKKAFELLCQKGDYLIDLLNLYLDSKRNDEALALYYSIQKQPWSQEFPLPAELLSRLSKQLSDRNDYLSAHACIKEAHLKEPKNKQYKNSYYELTLSGVGKAFQKLKANNFKNEESIEELKALAGRLGECWSEGFEGVTAHKQPFQKLLGDIYGSIAKCYLDQCLIPLKSDDYFDKDDLKLHIQEHQTDIQQALHYFDEALNVHPKSASFHFDKGMLLEYWMTDYDEALKEYELAVKYEPRNPYYHWLLGQAYFVAKSDSDKKNEHFELAEQLRYDPFEEDRSIFNKEVRFKEKSKQIDPHSYTKPKGWLD